MGLFGFGKKKKVDEIFADYMNKAVSICNPQTPEEWQLMKDDMAAMMFAMGMEIAQNQKCKDELIAGLKEWKSMQSSSFITSYTHYCCCIDPDEDEQPYMYYWLGEKPAQMKPIAKCVAFFCDLYFDPTLKGHYHDEDHPLPVKDIQDVVAFSSNIYLPLVDTMREYCNEIYNYG